MYPRSRTGRVGAALVFLGVTSYGVWMFWLLTRTEAPVDTPMSMGVGHARTPEFKINLSATYVIDIEVEKKIPFEVLNCLLGTSMAATSTTFQECPDRPSVVKASWVLTSEGHVEAHGSSEDYRSAGWRNDSISREIGSFHAQSGRRYVLDVDVLADGSALRPGNPRLKVRVDPMVVEGHAVFDGILLLASGALVLIGIAGIIVSIGKKKRPVFPAGP